MQRLHILLCPHERTVIHAATGLSLLDLNQENRADHITLGHWEVMITGVASIWSYRTRAGRLEGESCRQWPLWMRCRWTSSSAEGSVQKWSAVFTLVYSRAQGPTVAMGLKPNQCFHKCVDQGCPNPVLEGHGQDGFSVLPGKKCTFHKAVSS